MHCSKCGYPSQNGAAFCAQCGAKIEPPQYTPPYQGYYGGSQTFSPTPPPSLEVSNAEAKAITALVLGIISIAASVFLAGLVMGPLAIVHGKTARAVLPPDNHHSNIGLAGIITGIAGIAVSVFMLIYYIFIASLISQLL